jgi:signal transduction histidine kinase
VIDAVETVRDSAGQEDLDPMAGLTHGDPRRLQQVVWNLLSNAVKFTPNGGSIDVLLGLVGTQLQIVIRDSGAGIDPETLPHVFERFRQADSSTTRRHGGLGLGLSIVKRLVELHAGEVRVESAGKGLGASFIVTLPMSPAMVDGERGAVEMASAASLAADEVDLTGVEVL